MNQNDRWTLAELATELRVGYQLRQAVAANAEGKTALVSLGNVRDGLVSLEDVPTMELAGIRAHYFLREEDVLLRSRGASYGAAVVPPLSQEAVALAPLFVLRVAKHLILPEYLVWYINRPTTQARLKTFEAGTNIPSVSIQAFGELEVIVPPLAVQRHIATIAQLQREERKLAEALQLCREKKTQTLLETLLAEPGETKP